MNRADQVGVLEEGRLVQAGTPEEIYHQPATPFVARFTGLAGEVRVQVVSHASDGAAEVRAIGTGKVSDVAFRGRGYELAIDLPGHGRLTGVFARNRVARGDQVGLRLVPAGIHLFPARDGNADGAAGAGSDDPAAALTA